MARLSLFLKTNSALSVDKIFHLTHEKRAREEKIIHRLRIGIMGLHEDLHKLVGLHENGKCNLCPEIENVEHYLISCPQYIIPRAMLLSETNISESYLIMRALKKPPS